MTTKTVQSFNNVRKFRLGAEWKVFIWCFFISIILWLLTSLNDTYNDRIAVKVNYLNRPEDEVFVKPLPEALSLAVNAKGWDLIGYAVKVRSAHINIDLSQYRSQNFILSRRLKYDLQQQFSQDIFINEIYPDTISLATDNRLTKRVPIKLNLEIAFADQYQLGGPVTFSPDSVTITGPASMIKNMDTLQTRAVKLQGLKESKSIALDLTPPKSKNIQYSENKITVDIPVFQLTEQVVEVPIEIINQSISADIRLIPERATITYLTTLNNYQGIVPEMFEAVVDGSQMDTTNIVPLKVQIISQPDFTYNLRLKDEYVNYIINK